MRTIQKQNNYYGLEWHMRAGGSITRVLHAIELLNKVHGKLDKGKEQLASLREQAESARDKVTERTNSLQPELVGAVCLGIR